LALPGLALEILWPSVRWKDVRVKRWKTATNLGIVGQCYFRPKEFPGKIINILKLQRDLLEINAITAEGNYYCPEAASSYKNYKWLQRILC
jgi:hypothetical protein